MWRHALGGILYPCGLGRPFAHVEVLVVPLVDPLPMWRLQGEITPVPPLGDGLEASRAMQEGAICGILLLQVTPFFVSHSYCNSVALFLLGSYVMKIIIMT